MAQKRSSSSRSSSGSGRRTSSSRSASASRRTSASQRRRRQPSPMPPVIAALFCALCLIITMGEHLGLGIPTWDEIFSYLGVVDETPYQPADADGTVRVHFIDVGQGDSILIQTPKQNVLIDAGENNKGETVERYLKSQGVSSLDMIIGTHPHSDHIGGMDYVVDHFRIGRVLMPKLPSSLVPTTRTYTDLLDAIDRKKLKIINPKVGDTYDLGGGASLQIIGPNGEFDDLNHMSIMSRLTFGKTAFLFTGDAETQSEAAVLNRKGLTLSADVLDTGHHGSSTSTSEKFLEAVSPTYAAMSLGTDNEYGHPHRETLDKFKKYGITYYRTDLDGSIVFTSDGEEITVKTAK